MLDIDGTIYQTLDLKEAAWHATKANGRSIGIEIANIGAYPVGRQHSTGGLVSSPTPTGASGSSIPGEVQGRRPDDSARVLRPIRNEKIVGTIQGETLEQYDFTPQQYEALAKLTATLCTVFPKIRCDYPRDEKGALITAQATRRRSTQATRVSWGTITSRRTRSTRARPSSGTG